MNLTEEWMKEVEQKSTACDLWIEANCTKHSRNWYRRFGGK